MSTHLPPMPMIGVPTIAAACDELVVARKVLAATDSVAAAMSVNLRRIADLFR
jgi:uncharacterized protein YqgC (DUF456 family)